MTLSVEVVFCDDIRFEVGGKHTLVGVYTSDIRTNSVPIDVQLSLWIRIRGLSIGTHNFSISISENNSEPQSGASGSMDVLNEKYPVPLVIGPLFVRLSKAGFINAEVKVGQDIFTSILDVGIGPSPDFKTDN